MLRSDGMLIPPFHTDVADVFPLRVREEIWDGRWCNVHSSASGRSIYGNPSRHCTTGVHKNHATQMRIAPNPIQSTTSPAETGRGDRLHFCRDEIHSPPFMRPSGCDGLPHRNPQPCSRHLSRIPSVRWWCLRFSRS